MTRLLDAGTPLLHVHAPLPPWLARGTLSGVATSSTDAPLRALEPTARTPSWARWNGAVDRLFTVGLEEEVMLLRPLDYSLAEESDAVLARLPVALRPHVSPETHAGVLELKTGVHATARGAAVELAALRRRLALVLACDGMVAACAAMHPVAAPEQTRLSRADRYRMIGESLRFLARRQPTMALHVHVGVPHQDDAIRVLGRLRESIPVLLALSANSPFVRGSDSGFCSTRTIIFGGFPRTGPPRAYASYDEYVGAIDDLIALDALPGPTFLWWDVRLQPALGTVEVRVMDAQASPHDVAPITALVQSLARRELECAPLDAPASPEVLEENRFLAARDGLDAHLIEPRRRRRVPVRALVRELVDECWPHAVALGCAPELGQVTRLAAQGGAARQRAWAAERGVDSIIRTLAHQFDGAGDDVSTQRCHEQPV